MRTACLLLILLVSGTAVKPQTKKIAYKSHSGSNEYFFYALEKELFDMGESNFGHAPQQLVKDAMLDSVIFVNDSLAIMVTSEYCTRKTNGGNTPRPKANLWRAGRENAPNHPLFSRQHSLDSIKNVLRKNYYFRNPVESVVFIGYDNEQEKKYKAFRSVPVQTGPGDSSSNFGGKVLLIVSLITVLSLAGGWLAWRMPARKPAVV